MKNIPRIYINENIETGKQFSVSKDIEHYLKKVMRTDKFIVFNNGTEFYAELIENMPYAICLMPSGRQDPSNNLTLAFAPIKQSRLEEMMSMATQMGVARLQPVITERVNEHYPKWDRIKKIIIEAAEQSGRNSVPELLAPMKFCEFLKSEAKLFFADERMAVDKINACGAVDPRLREDDAAVIFVGPEGGFSDKEFDALDKSGAIGISLGRTILRAEVAVVVAIAKLVMRN